MLTRNCIAVILIFVLFSIGRSQTQRWVYRYNGPGNNSDGAGPLLYAVDGNIYAAGSSTGNGTSSDFTVISLTSTGNERWSYRYNGPGNSDDWANSLVYGADGNVYVAGTSIGSGTSDDFAVISLTSTGTQRWVYRYNGPGNDYDFAYSLVYGTDGNIYVAGFSTGNGTSYDFTVISLTSAGNERWVYRYNGPGNSDDWALSLVCGADGNIYAAGFSWAFYEDFTVISLSSTGTERWVYQYNGPGNDMDIAFSLVCGADGNIYIAGTSTGNGTSYDFTVISLTSTGTQRWVYRYNGPGNSDDGALSLVCGADGNIYAAGRSTGNGTSSDYTVISLTSTGTERWVYRYNGPGNDWDYANSLVYGTDGNVYVAGSSTGNGTSSDATVINLTSTGTQRWVYRYNGPGNDYDYANSLVYGTDGNVYVAGSSDGIGTSNDFIVISLNPTIGIEENEIASLPLAMINRFEIYPSPAKAFFVVRVPQTLKQVHGDKITLKIFDVSGKVVKELKSSRVREMRVSLKDIKPGIYFVQLDNQTLTKKLVITK